MDGELMKNTMLKILCLSLLLLIGGSRELMASDQSDVRDAVQRIFEQLKARDYGAL